MVTIDFDPVDPICLDASAMPITLNCYYYRWHGEWNLNLERRWDNRYDRWEPLTLKMQELVIIP